MVCDGAAVDDGGDTSFAVDVTDTRFLPLWKGDSRFGLDPTSTAFKKTAAMQDILRAQRARRDGHDAIVEGVEGGRGARGDGVASEVSVLVSRVKRKFQQVADDALGNPRVEDGRKTLKK